MKLEELGNELDLEILTPELDLDREVKKVFSGDMLSEVMGNAPEESIWITIQIHENVLAIASLKNFSAIVFSSDRKPEVKVVERAVEENIPLFISKLTSFAISGRLFQLGLEA